MNIIAVTGYKPMEMGLFQVDDPKIDFVKETIKRRLIPWIEEGLEWVLISGNMGVEIWTGEVIIDLKETYDIKLGIFPPFLNHETRWPDSHQEQYRMLVESADFFKPLYNKEYEGPYQFQARDQWLLKKSDACLLLYDEETGGTPKYFLDKAKQYQDNYDYAIYFITPFDIDDTVQEMMMEDPDYWSE